MTFETLGVAFLATDAILFVKFSYLYIEKIKTEQPLIALKEAESLSCSMGGNMISLFTALLTGSNLYTCPTLISSTLFPLQTTWSHSACNSLHRSGESVCCMTTILTIIFSLYSRQVVNKQQPLHWPMHQLRSGRHQNSSDGDWATSSRGGGGD